MSEHKIKVLVMAGGTGGHIIPGLAVAQELKSGGADVAWLGGEGQTMENKLVNEAGISFYGILFNGFRGSSKLKQLAMPYHLSKAFFQARKALKQFRPQVVLGMGGYITVPGGLAAKSLGIPVLVHEQNSVPGMANKLLAKFAKTVLTGFPNITLSSKPHIWIGNPVRNNIAQLDTPEIRYELHQGPLRLAVIGGSLGAQALNEVVPKAIALLGPQDRPTIIHQSGENNLESLHQAYKDANVEAQCLPFITEMSNIYANSDLLICRSGAMTVSEIASAGIASIMVPYPHAVDNHQSTNAKWLATENAGIVIEQNELTPEKLAQTIQTLTREHCLELACHARKLSRAKATSEVAALCIDTALSQTK